MAEDPRCCGSGTCIIDTEGHCWCGQQWNGEKMAAPPPVRPSVTPPVTPSVIPSVTPSKPILNTAPPLHPDIAAHP